MKKTYIFAFSFDDKDDINFDNYNWYIAGNRKLGTGVGEIMQFVNPIIKPMPETKETYPKEKAKDYWLACGYNDCIDEILGDV